MKKVLIIFLMIIIFLFVSISIPNSNAFAITCDFTVPTNVYNINGRNTPYNTLKPGDTICISAGTRGTLYLRNFSGSIDNPIVIINYGGQVIIDTTTGYGMSIANIQHVRITGTGSADKYGFVIQRAKTFGILDAAKPDYIEIDHFEFRNIIGYVANVSSSIGIHITQVASCPVPNGKNSDEWDYNGDGIINVLDAVDRSTFNMHEIIIHDNYFHGSIPSDIGLSHYIGNSNYSTIPYTRSCIEADGSITYGVVVLNPVVYGLHIYNETVYNTGDKAMQFGSAVADCEINNNTFDHTAQLEMTDIGSININTGDVCDVHDNTITNSGGNGITYSGMGGFIRNNYIENVGTAGTYWHDGIYVDNRPSSFHHGQSLSVTNNIIINPVGYGITWAHTEGTDNLIEYNTIAHPGFGTYIYKVTGAVVTIRNNILVPDELTLTPQITKTSTPVSTVTPTSTETKAPTPTLTHTLIPTETKTPTLTSTSTSTPTNTLIPTSTSTKTLQPTNTSTSTPTKTSTKTPTSTPTKTLQPTNTPTPTAIPKSCKWWQFWCWKWRP